MKPRWSLQPLPYAIEVFSSYVRNVYFIILIAVRVGTIMMIDEVHLPLGFSIWLNVSWMNGCIWFLKRASYKTKNNPQQ